MTIPSPMHADARALPSSTFYSEYGPKTMCVSTRALASTVTKGPSAVFEMRRDGAPLIASLDVSLEVRRHPAVPADVLGMIHASGNPRGVRGAEPSDGSPLASRKLRWLVSRRLAFELHWRVTAQRRVVAAVVEAAQEVENLGLGLLAGGERAKLQQFALEGGKRTFREGVGLASDP